MKNLKAVKLNQKFKRKWINALRSGKYERGTGFLKKPNTKKYCCIGVACKIAGIPVRALKDSGMPKELSPIQQAKLPPFFRDKSNERLQILANLNDTGHSFEKIADYIEKYL